MPQVPRIGAAAVVDTHDHPPVEPALPAPESNRSDQLGVAELKVALATHIVRIDEHRAGALCELGDTLVERSQGHALRRHRHAQTGGLQDELGPCRQRRQPARHPRRRGRRWLRGRRSRLMNGGAADRAREKPTDDEFKVQFTASLRVPWRR